MIHWLKGTLNELINTIFRQHSMLILKVVSRKKIFLLNIIKNCHTCRAWRARTKRRKKVVKVPSLQRLLQSFVTKCLSTKAIHGSEKEQKKAYKLEKISHKVCFYCSKFFNFILFPTKLLKRWNRLSQWKVLCKNNFFYSASLSRFLPF